MNVLKNAHILETADLVGGLPVGTDATYGTNVVLVLDATMANNKIFVYKGKTWYEVTDNAVIAIC